MHLDRWGLPVQADGDANDQLQRVGMCMTAYAFGANSTEFHFTDFYFGLTFLLQPKPGLFRRHAAADTDNCSADQLIGALAALVSWQIRRPALAMLGRMCLRLGFAQNYKDGLGPSTATKLPDFMALRAMPLFCRIHKLGYPLALIFDAYLPLLALGDWIYQHTDNDPADVNNTLLTLLICRKYMQTPWSIFAAWLWGKLRPDICKALTRYHREEAGGNPEVARLFYPLIRDTFTQGPALS